MSKQKQEEEELSSRGKGIFLLVACALLSYWQIPGFVEDLQLFFGGDTIEAITESKRTEARNDVYEYYFLAEGDTIRNESGMFPLLMSMTSYDGEDSYRRFKVVYDTETPEVHYPRATLRVHFFLSLIVVLFALLLFKTAIDHLRENK